MIEVPADILGREFDLGIVEVTAEMIADFARAVDSDALLADASGEAPATFCLSLHRGMTPEVPLPPDCFGVYGGHDIEVLRPIRAGNSYRLSARIVDSFEKSGRSGPLAVIAREVVIREAGGEIAVRIQERQMVRRRPH